MIESETTATGMAGSPGRPDVAKGRIHELEDVSIQTSPTQALEKSTKKGNRIPKDSDKIMKGVACVKWKYRSGEIKE